MKRFRYKNYIIDARCNELQNHLGWSPYFLIEHHDDSGVTCKAIYIKGVFDKEEEALEYAAICGLIYLTRSHV